MKKNRTSLIITALLVLASLYFLFFRDSFSTLGQKDNDFAVQDTAAITKIFMADKDNRTVTLTRVKGGEWMVNKKYKVRSDAISTLLFTIKMVTVENIIDPTGVPNVIKALASGAIKVEIYEGDKRVKVYYVGGPTADQLGTYMLLANQETGKNVKEPYITYIPGFNGYLSTRYFINQDDWRDRTIFRYYPYALKTVKLTYPQSDSGFTVNVLGRNRFSLSNSAGQPVPVFDTIAVKQYLTYYQDVEWELTVEGAKNKDSILNSPPIAIMNVTDTTGKLTTVKLFNKKTPPEDVQKYGKVYKYDPDQMFALVNGKDFVMVQYFVFGKMLENIKYFLAPEVENVEK